MCYLVGVLVVVMVLKVVVENRLNIEKIEYLRRRDCRNKGYLVFFFFKMIVEISVVERVYVYIIIFLI